MYPELGITPIAEWGAGKACAIRPPAREYHAVFGADGISPFGGLGIPHMERRGGEHAADRQPNDEPSLRIANAYIEARISGEQRSLYHPAPDGGIPENVDHRTQFTTNYQTQSSLL